MDQYSTFMIDGITHQVGNQACPACEGEVLGPCQYCVGGLVHQQVINSYEGLFEEKCDVCS